MIQYLIAAGIGAILGKNARKKKYARGGKVGESVRNSFRFRLDRAGKHLDEADTILSRKGDHQGAYGHVIAAHIDAMGMKNMVRKIEGNFYESTPAMKGLLDQFEDVIMDLIIHVEDVKDIDGYNPDKALRRIGAAQRILASVEGEHEKKGQRKMAHGGKTHSLNFQKVDFPALEREGIHRHEAEGDNYVFMIHEYVTPEAKEEYGDSEFGGSAHLYVRDMDGNQVDYVRFLDDYDDAVRFAEYQNSGRIGIGRERFAKGGEVGGQVITYEVSNIKYDTDGERLGLPTSLTIEVPADFEGYEADEYISDRISDITGFAHFGFSTTPEIVYAKGGQTSESAHDEMDALKKGDTIRITRLTDNRRTETPILLTLVRKGRVNKGKRNEQTKFKFENEDGQTFFAYKSDGEEPRFAFGDMGIIVSDDIDFSPKMAHGGKTQGYNDKLDESLGSRHGSGRTKEQGRKDRRDESEAMERSMGRRKYAAVGSMDKGDRMMAQGGRVLTAEEWASIKPFNKHIGRDGQAYIAVLDEEKGTKLVPVIVMDNEGRKMAEGGQIPIPKEVLSGKEYIALALDEDGKPHMKFSKTFNGALRMAKNLEKKFNTGYAVKKFDPFYGTSFYEQGIFIPPSKQFRKGGKTKRKEVSSFDKLAMKVAARYRAEGKSNKEAMEIGRGTAAKVYRQQQAKKGKK